jgi:hypothetical protein
MLRIDEQMKTTLAMSAGALTSMGTYFSGAINKFSVTMASVPVLSIEFLYIVFTAFVTGMAGAFGAWVLRETFKLISKFLFPDNSNQKRNSKDNDE